MATGKPALPRGGELPTVAAEQRRELMAAQALESDLDLVFQLQLQEAITASLSLQPSSSSLPLPQFPVSHPSNDGVSNVVDLQTLELEKLDQELNDLVLTEAETKKMREDFSRRIHDQQVARDIQRMPEDEWEEQGDYFERPYGEGSSRNANTSEVFRVYFKGLVCEEEGIGDSSPIGIGIAICDSNDELIFELRKRLVGNDMSRRGAESKALIEGLNAAIALDLKRVVLYCDYYPIYQFVTGRWPPKQRKIATLINQVALLKKKFTYCRVSLVARNDIKFAFKLAREAIDSHINKPEESSRAKNETCVICLEEKNVGQIFSVDGCMHRYCFSCMKQHVEVKLHQVNVPKCPHEGCNSELKIDRCGKFLTPKYIELMSQRVEEASIPCTEKIYCPYPKCSALMSKSQVLEYCKTAFAGAERSGARQCIKCHSHFCIDCKVPWHSNMTCSEYKSKNPNPLEEDAKLKTLAAMNLWRQCVKCNHMIELVAGCYHMTCRCGYEFCYTCGAEWKNKKATCTCPLWDDENILDDEDEDEFDEDEFDEDELLEDEVDEDELVEDEFNEDEFDEDEIDEDEFDDEDESGVED